MPEQILIGNFPKGLTLDRLPFNIDNDAFPYLLNFYVWRGRVKRKRGTLFLGRLQIQERIAAVPSSWQRAQFALVAGAGNLISQYTLGASSSITPRSIALVVGANTYTDPAASGVLVGTPAGSGTINYATGAFTIAGGGSGNVTGDFSYYPGLPVMGLRNFSGNAVTNALDDTNDITIIYPKSVDFDTKKSYQIQQTSAQTFFYNVSFYRGTNNPVTWSGQDYQQFWVANYSAAMWASNGKAGLHLVNGTYTSGSTTTAITFNFKSVGVNFTRLIVGDVLWFNEWSGSTLNGFTGTVSNIAGAATGDYVVTFATARTAAGTGIAQLLTSGISGQDGIKWYDGDPTNATGYPVGNGLGWSNFAPPLTATSVSINNIPAGLYYLVGALIIIPFKDRLVFFGPQIQTSSGGVIQLPIQDTAIWSWNGTPYYANAPTGETADTTAYYVDQTGNGGYKSAGLAQPIVTVNPNEDVLLVGFSNRATRFTYTSNDLDPFQFYSINSELGDTSTFSGVTLDRGAITIGTYGIALTNQISKSRIDLQIPDEIFKIRSINAGVQRINSARDFYREWIYFSYPPDNSQWRFPTRSFFYNYREDSWGIFYENYTAHGTYRQTTGYTWATIPYPTWESWSEPWNSGYMTADFPAVIAGNPQGFVVIKGQGTGEAQSGQVQAISSSNSNLGIQSIDHCLSVGDYLYFANFTGTSSTINGQIGKVISIADANNFVVDVPFSSGTYLGLGTFARLSQPELQTKQFNPYWNEGRQVRIGVQKYLMDRTDDSFITVQIYLSQDPDNPWTSDAVVPDTSSTNNSLLYSEIMATSPEIGSLQSPIAASQRQIWHRMNNSLIGDTFQIGMTLSDAQMRRLSDAQAEVTCHAMQFTIDKGPLVS